MRLQDFTEDKQVLLIIDDLQEKRAENPEKFIFSDVVDEAGHQYVDFVQEGGGVLGIALLGYTYVLEQMGIRFLKLAGTSAGAINTVLIAGAGKPHEAKSEKIIEHVANKNFLDFVDGDSDSKKFINAIIEGSSWFTLGFRGLRILDNLKEDLGLNPGQEFYKWLNELLEGWGICSTEDLDNQLRALPDSVNQTLGAKAPKEQAQNKDWQIAIVAADITTETKVVFPQMAHLYFPQPKEVSPAKYVRASMSVPLFFSPFKVPEVPNDPKFAIPNSPAHKLAWEEITNYIGPHPEEVMFVDGGIMSNFPIDIFHAHDKVPQRPTFGVKLGLDRNKINYVGSMDYKNLLGSCFNAARNIRDQDFISSNPDYQKLVAHIETGDHNWINFGLKDEDKLDLFRRGARKAAQFLLSFDWKKYQDLRRNKLFSIASKVLDKPVTYFTKKLENAGKLRQLPIDEKDKEILVKRLQFIEALGQGIKVLWIDDIISNDQDIIDIIRLIGGEFEFVKSSKEAEYILKKNKFNYDCIISDIKRDNNPSEGIDFLVRLNKEFGHVPPAIFYITNYDPSKGTPPYAFGITNKPIELIHFVADIIQRKPVIPPKISS